MSTLRSILLHLDASPRSATRLLLARELAQQHDAAITALYASTPSLLDMPFAFAEGPAGALSALQELDRQPPRQREGSCSTGGRAPLHLRCNGAS